MVATAFLIFLLIFEVVAIMILTSNLKSIFYGAPFVPIKKKFIKDILAFGGLSVDDIFYDLGCGDGRVLISGVQDFGAKKAVGYEVTWWPYWIAKWKIRKAGLGNKITIHRKNFFDADLSEASFIYMYLFPKLVNQLAEKISRECHSGTKILCPSFPIDCVPTLMHECGGGAPHPQFQLLKTEKFDKISVYLYEKI